MKRALEGTVILPGKYSRLVEEAMLEYKEEQLTLVGPRYKISPEGKQN